MGRLGEEDRNVEAASQNRKPGDVILVLVGDQDGIELRRIFAGDASSA